MRGDILAGDVGDKFLKPVTLAVEDQADLAALLPGPEPRGPDEKPELEGHVEPRQLMGGVEFRARDIMHPETAAANHGKDLLDPDLAGVVDLESTARHIATVKRREDQRIENRLVGLVEGAVKEDACLVGGVARCAQAFASCDAATARTTRRIAARDAWVGRWAACLTATSFGAAFAAFRWDIRLVDLPAALIIFPMLGWRVAGSKRCLCPNRTRYGRSADATPGSSTASSSMVWRSWISWPTCQ